MNITILMVSMYTYEVFAYVWVRETRESIQTWLNPCQSWTQTWLNPCQSWTQTWLNPWWTTDRPVDPLRTNTRTMRGLARKIKIMAFRSFLWQKIFEEKNEELDLSLCHGRLGSLGRLGRCENFSFLGWSNKPFSSEIMAFWNFYQKHYWVF